MTDQIQKKRAADRIPTADEIWTRYRDVSWQDLADMVGVHRATLRDIVVQMGFRRDSHSRITHAPCAGCNEPHVPVDRLDSSRRCHKCRGGQPEHPEQHQSDPVPYWKVLYDQELARVRKRRRIEFEEAKKKLAERRERLRAAGWLIEDEDEPLLIDDL